MGKIEETIELNNSFGLHVRIASELVKRLKNISSEVTISFEDVTVDAKSILSLLSLQIKTGSKIIFRAKGEDAKRAYEIFHELISHKDEVCSGKK